MNNTDINKEESLIHIHEDNWELRNLYPKEAKQAAQEDIECAIEIEKENRAPDGMGWTDIHVINAPEINYSKLGLTSTTVQQALYGIMPAVYRFYATASSGFQGHDVYGSYDEEAICYGFGQQCFIKIESSNHLVSSIWFDVDGANSKELLALRHAIEAVNNLHPSIITDYNIGLSGEISDTSFLSTYFEALMG